MFRNKPRIGQELLDVPMGDMIREMAFAIAEAQIRLDENSIDVAEMMGGLKTITDANGNVTFEDSRVFFGQQKFKPSEAAAYLNTGDATEYEKGVITKSGTGVTYSETNKKYEGTGTTEITVPRRMSMLELGFTPTFYQFVDTIIEVKIAIKYTQEGSVESSSTNTNRNTSTNLKIGFGKAKVGRNISTSQVNATYSQKYSYSAEGSSLLRTKLVPIPPPAILEERIRKMMEEEFDKKETPTP